jgi:IS30 family transposase
MHNTHLKAFERDIIALRLHQNVKQNKIAQELNRDPSVISREIRRNSTYVNWFDSPRGTEMMYFPDKAQKKYRKRINKSNVNYPFKSPNLMRYVVSGLEKEWSPDTISGKLKKDFPDDSSMRISHEKIYQDCFTQYGISQGWNKMLLRGKNKRADRVYKTARADRIPGRIDIDERPVEADERSEFGHWEIDTVWSSDRYYGLLVIVERKTRYTYVSLIPRKNKEEVLKSIKKLLLDKKELVKSITFDNGSEFAGHRDIAELLDCDTYFCKPYSSWERGTCENTNGRIRRRYPKKTNFKKIRESDLLETLKILVNNHPRKCLNYDTPSELFEIEVQKIAFTR